MFCDCRPCPFGTARVIPELGGLDAGLTARALALAVGWHESKCSRIEHVRTAPSEADIRLWCQVCGTGDQAADLIASLRAADSMYGL